MLSELILLSLSVTTLHLIAMKYNLEEKYLNWSDRPTSQYCRFCVSFWLGVLLLLPLKFYIQGSLSYEVLIVLWGQPALTSYLMGSIDS